MNRYFCSIAVFLSVHISTSLAAPTDGDQQPRTNKLAAAYESEPYTFTSTAYSEDFLINVWEHMEEDSAYANAFGELTKLGWFRASQIERYQRIDSVNRIGRDVFKRTIENGFREGFVSRLSYEVIVSAFLGDDTRLATFVDNRIRDSVGNTKRRYQQYVSGTASADSLAEMIEYEEMSAFVPHFGYRGDNVYLSLDAGRQHRYSGLGFDPIVHLDVRLRFMVSSLDQSGELRMLKLESQARFPLPFNSQFVLAAGMYPGQFLRGFDTQHYSPAWAARFETLIGPKERAVGILSLGYFDGPGEHAVFFQFTCPIDFWNKHLRHG